jgi:head-tail adaptor
MGLLDGGLARIFYGAFNGIFLDATLHRPNLTDNGKGGGSNSWTDEPVKAQLDHASEAMRASERFVETDQRIIVLAYGLDPIDTDCEITVKGKRWSIAGVATDPATAAYELHGRLA